MADTPADPLSVHCPDCAVPAGEPCRFSIGYLIPGDDETRVHAERQRSADLRAVDHGTCALCTRPMVRGTIEGRPVDAWHPDPADASRCPVIPNPAVDPAGWATAINLGLEPGRPGVEHFRETPPCGHVPMQPGCGGCDPSAVDLVIEDGSTTPRPFDPARDLHDAAGVPSADDPPGTWERADYEGGYEPTCPDCTAGKHDNCTGDAWDHVRDAPAPCTCIAAAHPHRPPAEETPT